ncbi:uncharacterized protein LOC143912371 [Arctopsyche grandis]|uniref:uncharacterized protein LOC143912371 n=1 Tax=Arctopsyche grandis TaxID=121162 RepID=UPI00406D6A6D
MNVLLKLRKVTVTFIYCFDNYYFIDPVELKRKRQRSNGDANSLLRHLHPPAQDIAYADQLAHLPVYNPNIFSPESNIKIEPIEQTPSPYGGNYGQLMYRTMQATPSPQPYPTPSPPHDFVPGVCINLENSLLPQNQLPLVQIPQDHATFSNLFTEFIETQQPSDISGLSLLLEGTESAGRLDSNQMNIEQESMMDSLSRLTTRAYDALNGACDMTNNQ